MAADAGRLWLRRRVGRKRLAAGWGLIALGVLSFALWLSSLWVETTWSRGGWTVQCINGSLSLYHERPSTASALRFEWVEPAPVWAGPLECRAADTPKKTLTVVRLGLGAGYHLVSTIRGAAESWCLMVLISPFSIATGVAGVVCLRSGWRVRRVGLGHCGRCGYDLKGLGAGVGCPECGRK